MLLLGMLSITILRRCLVAVSEPTAETVQAAVRHAILSLIVLDAAVAVEVSHWIYGCGILCLFAPAFLLSRWIDPT